VRGENMEKFIGFGCACRLLKYTHHTSKFERRRTMIAAEAAKKLGENMYNFSIILKGCHRR